MLKILTLTPLLKVHDVMSWLKVRVEIVFHQSARCSKTTELPEQQLPRLPRQRDPLSSNKIKDNSKIKDNKRREGAVSQCSVGASNKK